jgi:hypothetical protein
MAFSATVRGKGYMGGNGGLNVVYGDWSGLAGDASGTLSIGGRYVGSLWFKNDSLTAVSGQSTPNMSANSTGNQIFPAVQWDGNIPGNLTIQNQDNIGTGSFMVFTLGS